jgi:hypothetical protein
MMNQVSQQSPTYNNSPSLLRLIVDEIDAMDDNEKTEVLRKIKMQKALSLAKKADEMYEGKFREMGEDEIASMVSENRKSQYEQKNGH